MSFVISSLNEDISFDVDEAYAIPKEKFKMPSQHLPANFHTDKKWEYLRNLDLKDIKAEEIDLLVGADLPEALFPSKIIKCGKDQP